MGPSEGSGGPSLEGKTARNVGLAIGSLAVAGVVLFIALKPGAGPPPADIAKDGLLVRGREVYQWRCVSCHGEKGRGDGPIAKGLKGSPVGDLTAAHWKHGDRPKQVIEVVSLGVPNTNMAPWGRTLGGDDVRAVTAYVYHLSGRPVPEELRRARP